jgi:hypothetical protein
MKLLLIGGHPKGFDKPFHEKTHSGRILRKITAKLNIEHIFFDLWNNQTEQNLGIIGKDTIKELSNYIKRNYTLIALGKFTERSLIEEHIPCVYLPHPASRNHKYVIKLEKELLKYNTKK